jgi:hypothetical protein
MRDNQQGSSHRHPVVAVLAVIGLATAACENVGRTLIEELAERDCRLDAETRVSDERIGYFFAHTHVYRAPGDDLTDWANGLVNSAIPVGFDDMNAYLGDAGVGIAVLPLRSFVVQNADMAPVHVDSAGRPQSPSFDLIVATSSAEGLFVHSYWSPSVTTLGVGGYGGGRLPDETWLGMIERPERLRSPEARSRDMAHELGHVLGLGHETEQGNLMSPSGDVLRSDQIATIRNSVNTRWVELMVMSCERDPTLAQVVSRRSPADVLTAAIRVTAEDPVEAAS